MSGLRKTLAWRAWLRAEARRRRLTERAFLTELAMLGSEVYREYGLGRAGCILADPPWVFRTWGGACVTPHRTAWGDEPDKFARSGVLA